MTKQVFKKLSFKKLSIQKKLIITIMGISTIMLLSTLSIFITSELFSLKKTMQEDLSTLAELVGKNTYAAIMFYDKEAANESLQALKAKPHIVSAHLFKDSDQVFSEYYRDQNSHTETPNNSFPFEEVKTLIKNQSEGYYYINDHIHMLKPIIFEPDQSLIGYIHIESDRKVYWQRVNQYIYTILIMVCIALFLTLAFAFRAQKIFTDPLLKLLDSMHHVTTEHKYNKMIDNNHYDEFGELIDGYNNMLAQLEQQHQLTIHYQSNLEKRVEERTLQLRKARDEALSASRLKSIFLANMSHEIRTPMNAILGYAQLLQQSELDDEQMRRLSIIDKSGNHLLSLINDILELSKIEAGALEVYNSDFDLLELIHSVENMFKIRCDQKNINWRLECFNHKPILVNGDQGKLRQILINLLSNACKFTDQGEVLFKIEAIAENRYKFSVNDTGSGINKEALSSIFDAFHQEKQGIIKGGTGLGLNIARQYIELISGHLEVFSEINKGSNFYFDIELLPASTSFTAVKTDTQNTYTLATNRQMSALIVEDNRDDTELLSNILTPLGFSIICAENGQEALEEIEKNCPDIVFMDIRMPVMDGLEAIKIIRHKYTSAKLKCIAVTASTIQHSSKYYISAGFDLFISKPFRFDEIYHAVKNILGLKLQVCENTKKSNEIKPEVTVSASHLELDPSFIQELMQAAEYSQLTELKKLLKQLNQYGDAGEAMANHLELLIDTADLDGISEYVEGVINEQKHSG